MFGNITHGQLAWPHLLTENCWHGGHITWSRSSYILGKDRQLDVGITSIHFTMVLASAHIYELDGVDCRCSAGIIAHC